MITIEKNIPIDISKSNDIRDAFRRMEIGDSILVDNQSYLHQCAKYAKIKIKTKSKDGKTRVWRIA